MSDLSLRDKILELLGPDPAKVWSKSQICRSLKLPGTQLGTLRTTLQQMVREKALVLGAKNTYHLPVVTATAADKLIGTIKFHPKGHAYFFPDLTVPANHELGVDLKIHSRIFVTRRDVGTALDGDKVLASLIKSAPRPFRIRQEFSADPSDEMRVKIEQIVSRRSGRLVGIYQKIKSFAWVDCADPAIDGRIDLHGDTTAAPGQLVVVELDAWLDRAADPRGRIIEVLGWPGDAGVDMISIIHRFGLKTSFPDDVLEEARRVPEQPEIEEIARRRDWREPLVITIDPADAKDHDDAIWLEKSEAGWNLAVHIADVSHYIKPSSPMDREAIERGNSTYLVDRVLPMLPTELSNGICSLKPAVDRLTKCALLEISRAGEVTHATFFDAVIHSRAKLSYEQAQAILDGNNPPPNSDEALVPMVHEAWKCASAMRRRRFEQGALDLEMPEIKIALDENGRAVAANPVLHTASHQLIEECMLAANQAVAKLLRESMKPALFRIHEDPDPSRLDDFTQLAKAHGYHPGDLTNRAHCQKLLDESKGKPEEHIIRLGLLKSLKRAAYSADPLGHYGLAKRDYCHFTSPIRRYADLIVHRAMQPLLENAPANIDRVQAYVDLLELARHLSETERTSADAENESKQLKLMEFLAYVATLPEPPLYDGLITDTRPMGLMVEVPSMGVRGVVKREDLPAGRWRFESNRMAWIAMDGAILQLGMRVPLRVEKIDMEKRFVDFSVAGKPTSAGLTDRMVRGRPPSRHHSPPHTKTAATSGPSSRHRGAKATPEKGKAKIKRRRR